MFNITFKLATHLLLAVVVLSGVAPRTGFADEKPAKKDDKDKKQPEWVGSIKVEKKVSEDELAKLAKISKKEAKAAAAKAIKGGEAEDAELKVVRGYLVYVVEVEVE